MNRPEAKEPAELSTIDESSGGLGPKKTARSGMHLSSDKSGGTKIEMLNGEENIQHRRQKADSESFCKEAERGMKWRKISANVKYITCKMMDTRCLVTRRVWTPFWRKLRRLSLVCTANDFCNQIPF
jgi:hypothetical protein